MHHRPELFGYDAAGKQIGSPVDLSRYNQDYDSLHALFSSHFVREKVAAPSLAVRVWRRLFGWAYGISNLEAAIYFLCAGAVRTTPYHASLGNDRRRFSRSHLSDRLARFAGATTRLLRGLLPLHGAVRLAAGLVGPHASMPVCDSAIDHHTIGPSILAIDDPSTASGRKYSDLKAERIMKRTPRSPTRSGVHACCRCRDGRSYC